MSPKYEPACTQVRITADKENKLLIIEDSGVGLTKEEMIANLGRIAQSGIVKSFRSRRSFISSPLWTPYVYGPTS